MSDDVNPVPIVMEDIMALAARVDELGMAAVSGWRPALPDLGPWARGPSACLLHFEVGAMVPRHAHTGYEHIIVLDGGRRMTAATIRPARC